MLFLVILTENGQKRPKTFHFVCNKQASTFASCFSFAFFVWRSYTIKHKNIYKHCFVFYCSLLFEFVERQRLFLSGFALNNPKQSPNN